MCRSDVRTIFEEEDLALHPLRLSVAGYPTFRLIGSVEWKVQRTEPDLVDAGSHESTTSTLGFISSLASETID